MIRPTDQEMTAIRRLVYDTHSSWEWEYTLCPGWATWGISKGDVAKSVGKRQRGCGPKLPLWFPQEVSGWSNDFHRLLERGLELVGLDLRWLKLGFQIKMCLASPYKADVKASSLQSLKLWLTQFPLLPKLPYNPLQKILPYLCFWTCTYLLSSPTVLPVLELHINGIKQYATFCCCLPFVAQDTVFKIY